MRAPKAGKADGRAALTEPTQLLGTCAVTVLAALHNSQVCNEVYSPNSAAFGAAETPVTAPLHCTVLCRGKNGSFFNQCICLCNQIQS